MGRGCCLIFAIVKLHEIPMRSLKKRTKRQTDNREMEEKSGDQGIKGRKNCSPCLGQSQTMRAGLSWSYISLTVAQFQQVPQ